MELKNSIKLLQDNNYHNINYYSIKEKQKKLNFLIHQEELWWDQRAKVHWLKEGDINTSYLYHKANQRKTYNNIKFITKVRWRYHP